MVFLSVLWYKILKFLSALSTMTQKVLTFMAVERPEFGTWSRGRGNFINDGVLGP
jgi:hypothetical protein